MTRFARAKGSKASNERVPEEATSWQEMKNQLQLKQKETEDSKKRKEFENKRQENYNKFVETVENERVNNTVWSEFPQEPRKPKSLKSIGVKNTGEETGDSILRKDFNKDCVVSLPKKNKRTNVEVDDASEKIDTKIIPTKKIKKEKLSTSAEDDGPEEVSAKVIPAKEVKKEKNDMKIEDDDAPEEASSKIVKFPAVKTKKKTLPKNKPLIIPKVGEEPPVTAPKSKKKDWSHLTEEQIQHRMTKKREKRQLRSQKLKAKKKLLAENIEQPKAKSTSSKEKLINNKKQLVGEINSSPEKLTRKDKIDQKVEYKRRKPESNAVQEMIINGQKVKVVLFSGYPIRKEDADRLTLLKKQMISKSIPRSEIDRTLKLERRKCEKALTRLKKVLCFNCRKSGHNLSECPQLENKQTSATGICFKCGSTEHTHFECKVVRATDFKFAECFICKEQGHIARQCPENPRGLYPKGGACKLCGDVTHFKKDCPTLQSENTDEKNTISVGTLNESTSLEGLDEENKKIAPVEKKQKIKKIKF